MYHKVLNLGSQTVHLYYRPLEDLEQLVKTFEENSKKQQLTKQVLQQSDSDTK